MSVTAILALALQAAVTAPTGSVEQPPPANDEDIVVLARRMQFIEVDIRAPRRNGLLVLRSCRVTNGSGNAEMDAVPCTIAQECMADTPPNRRALQNCVEERSQPRLDQLVERWRAAWTPQP